MASVARAADTSPPLWSLWLAFAGYVLLGIGFLVHARVRVDTASRTAFLDGAVIGTAMVMVLWVSLIAPLHMEFMDIAHRVTLAMAPIRDGVLVAILAWICLAPGRRTPALHSSRSRSASCWSPTSPSSTARNLDTDIHRTSSRSGPRRGRCSASPG